MTQQIARASARKSLGVYKPLIQFVEAGKVVKAEVVEQSFERQFQYSKSCQAYVRNGSKFARGTTYATKEEATAAAQREIESRCEVQMAELIGKNILRYRRESAEKFFEHGAYMIRLYGGTI